MSRIEISSKVLSWAVERSGKSMEYFEDKFPKIQQWITGEKQPTMRQVEDLAKKTSTPFGYFFLPEPPEESLSIPYYRTIKDDSITRPSANLLDTLHAMKRRQDWMREFLIDDKHDTLPFVNSANTNMDIQDIANDMRITLGLNSDWASKLRNRDDAMTVVFNTAERVGILVVVNGVVGNNTHRKLDTDEFRGFVLVDEYSPLVFINGSDYKAPQLFTFAHELAHIWFGKSAAFDLRHMQPSDNSLERKCDQVAAEFLVPGNEILDAWVYAEKDTDPFKYLAIKFKVSELVIARRLLDLGLISKDEFLDFYYQYQNKEFKRKSKTEGGDFNKNQNKRVGRRFAGTVIRAVKEGRLLYSEAYRLTDLYGKTFENYSRELIGYGSP